VIEKGKRYRFSFWYKTTEEVNPTVRLFLQGLPPRRTPIPVAPAAGTWRRWSMTFSGDDLIGDEKSSKETAIRTRLAMAERTLSDTKKALARHKVRPTRINPARVAKLEATLEKTMKQMAEYKAKLKDVTEISDSMRMDLQFQPRTLDKDEWMWIDDVELVTILEPTP
jgi:hypothetical protein